MNAEEKQKKNQKNHPKNIKILIEHIYFERTIKTSQENFKIIGWLCTGNNKISNREKVINEYTENCRNLVKQKNLCFN